MLLARLGLRAGEAAAARAGDIDWRSGTILVRGKGGHDERLPLPPDVGAAIADYCRHGRPAGAGSGMLFLHVRAPYGRVSPSTVGNVVKRACLRAGLRGQRPSAAARRRDGDAAGRSPAVGDQPAAAPPARGHDIEVRHHRPGRARSRDSPVAGGSVMTGLRGQVRGYLALRRAMGFKMEKHGLLLDSLAGHLDDAGLATVTVQAAAEWAMLPQGVHPYRWKQRLDVARGFARYLAAADPAAEVPPMGMLAARPRPARALHLHRAGDRRAARGCRAAPLAPARRHLSRLVRPDCRDRHAARRGCPP